MYKILWKSDSEDLHEKIIDDKDAQELISAYDFLNRNIRCLDFYCIVKKNLTEMLNYMNCQQDYIGKPDGTEINRLLYNFTNSFYAYIEYLERNFKSSFSIV